MKKIILAGCVISLAHLAEASEIKIGVMQHDLGGKFKQRYEKGKNLIAEYVFAEEYKFLYGLPHFGTSVNSKGYTSSAYTGLTWRYQFLEVMFAEVTFGGAVNNGETKKDKKRRAIGSNLMFRESFSLGVNLASNHSLSVMIDHMSNADLSPPNPGLTDVGIRYGYKF
jgi:lipid A 3-O-deacylase